MTLLRAHCLSTVGWIVLGAMLAQAVGFSPWTKGSLPYSEPAKESVEVAAEEAEPDDDRDGPTLPAVAATTRTLCENEAVSVSPAPANSGTRAALWCRPPPRV